MKKINTTIVIILISILIIFTLLITNYNKNREKQVCISSYCFDVGIARTEEERARGLMFRSSLNENQGMLFIFENEELYSFWMKNTLIPLDIIWINKEGKIVHIEHNVLPCSQENCLTYVPKEKAIYVLEINGGLAEKYNFREDDIVDIRI